MISKFSSIIAFLKKHFVAVVVIFAFSAGFSAIYSFFSAFDLKDLSGIDKFGQTGDFFGGILNPTFTFLGFGFLVYTITQNRENIKISNQQLDISNHQLKISSDALEATRIEMEGSKKALEEQSTALKQQNFENTFFNLIKLYHESITILETNSHGKIDRGRDCFLHFHTNLRQAFNNEQNNNYGSELKKIEKVYQFFLDKKEGRQLIYPFINIYAIIRFIDESSIANKRLYIRILMSQFSSKELAIFFYHSLHSDGRKRFHDFIEKYGLLQNLDKDMLFYGNVHLSLYSDSAYV